MVFFGYISLAAAVLPFIAQAAPTPASDLANKGHFSLRQQVNPNFKGKNSTAVRIKGLRKYNKPLPEALQAAAAASGSVDAEPHENDLEYTIPVTIGTGSGAQTLNMDLDSGSADLWVFSSSLPSSERSGHTYYTPSKDTTYKALSGYTWSIGYADGSGASGSVGTATVNVGGVTVTSQAVEVATSVSSQFVSDNYNSGLIGMSYGKGNTVSPRQQKTFFENVASSLTLPVFTADLNHNAAGSYDFGIIDSSKYTGDITYTSVISNTNGFWSFSSTVGGTKFTGIADTGTTLMYLPSSVVSSYFSKVSGAKYDSSEGVYTFSCSATLPDFTFTVGSATFSIAGEYMNYDVLSGNTCFGAAIPSTAPYVYGDIMFKSVFVVFNENDNQIGFAQK